MQKEEIPARLVLEDGSCFRGISFGKDIPCNGEVVFTTGMSGYPQYLTDPSFRGQILVSTFPLVGNYGVPEFYRDKYGIPVHFESDHIQASGFIVGETCDNPSHFASSASLSAWMRTQGIPGVCGIDTRALTTLLRNRGVMNGRILIGDDAAKHSSDEAAVSSTRPQTAEQIAPSGVRGHPVAEVSPRTIRVYDPIHGSMIETSPSQVSHPSASESSTSPIPAADRNIPTIVLVDCGAKANILRCLLARNVRVIRVPWNHDLEGIEYDGIFLSNGPGDPKACGKTIATMRRSLRGNKPLFGICLGNQILALAAGADTYKLPYGHRSQNQPCIEVGTKRCYITSQNHGYAVRGNTLPAGWEPWFVNANDDTIEGIRSTDGLFSAVQFHPEGCPGPRDTEFLIDRFIDLVQRSRA